MKILLTNLCLDGFGGSESWLYSMATELNRRGNEVHVYSPRCGKVYEKLKNSGITLATSGNFDLILDNHNQSAGKFTGFTIHTCHGIIPEERPMPNALNIAVSKKVSEKYGIDVIIPNSIDTNRFCCKNFPRDRIKKILSLCKSVSANYQLSRICQEHGLLFESMYGREIFNIEDKINEADLVVGVGRSLLDAMACGRPVVSFDDRSYFSTRMLGHGYITPDKFKFQQIDNFTASSIGTSLSKEDLEREIFEKYNPKDGEVNRQFIIENLSIEKAVDRYLELYNSSDNSKTFVSKSASSVKIDSNKYYGWT